MKKINLLLIAFLVATLSSCQIIGGLMKASFAVGIIITIVVVLVIIWLISFFRGRN